MQTPFDNLQAALEARAMGYTPVAMQPGLKVPADKWLRWVDESPTEASIRERWENTHNGVALLCKDLVVFDVDDENELDFVLASCGVRNAPICRTPRGGFHVHARARKNAHPARRIKLHGQPVDFLTGCSLSIIPPSTNEDGAPYEWLGTGLTPLAELPIARIAWTQTRPRSVLKPVENVNDSNVMVHRARAYLATVEGSISGQRGHDRAMRAAGILCQKFALSVEQALPIFREWSDASCEPPWSEKELLHKLQDAVRLRSRYQKGEWT